MMKSGFLLLFFSIAISLSGNSQVFEYKEIGDTIFVNGKTLLPGDTIHLGNGSAPDKSFIYIWQIPSGSAFKALMSKLKYLSNKNSGGYLIYHGRIDRGYNQMKLFLPAFYSPGNTKKLFTVNFEQAISYHEITKF